ncbi:MAG: hypothetical protein DMD38_15165 [Gemmatimonadetes bacterium]|nr:MAG: hypothetical protein DMD38_15165 [Gemmatimonadota bacterium]
MRSSVLAPDALSDVAGYAAEVGRLVRAFGIGLVLPVTDPSVEALLEHRLELPASVILPLPDIATYRAASDKRVVMALAAEAGFDVPETCIIASPGDSALPGDGFFPAVLKPHRSVVTTRATREQIAVSFVDDAAACQRALASLPWQAFPVLLQRRVQGPGEGLFVLRWGGEVIALFAHRRLREKPPAGGVSVYRESIVLEPPLVTAGLRLLHALEWNGLAMIECKRDRETGRHVIMEVNGRLWGSLQLALDAGVDFPSLLVRCALGLPVPIVRDYKVGVRSRWFWGDVDHLYLRLRKSAADLHLNGSSPSRLGAVMDFLRFRPGRDRWELWRWDDPAPFLLETARRLGLARR